MSGNVRFVMLPDLGIRGNTQLAFSELKKLEVAWVIPVWLYEQGLDR